MNEQHLNYDLPPIDAAFYRIVADANRDREILDIGVAVRKHKLTPREMRRLGFKKKGFMWVIEFPNKGLRRKGKRGKG